MDDSYDDELDEILVGVDLTSLPGRERDLSPELLGIDRPHANEASGTAGLAPPEEAGGELRQGGSACHGRALHTNNKTCTGRQNLLEHAVLSPDPPFCVPST